jgi:hypothetical protein
VKPSGIKNFLVRNVAMAMALFIVLSSGRSLVPGMCATLSAMQDGGACTTKVCCAAEPRPTSSNSPVLGIEKKHTDCAFCHLAKGIIQHESSVIVEAPCFTALETQVTHYQRPTLTERWNYSRPRDPPFLPIAV